MKKKKLMKVLIPVICAVLIVAIVVPVVLSSSNGKKKEAIVIMTEELSGLFNPFYATSATDGDVVSMTQVGMLSTETINDVTKVVAGKKYPTVVLDYKVEPAEDASSTVYTFVIKNGLKFSDGKPLTMNDVMFNLYEYLDPVYTGSSTMYSVKIKGLTQYRTQDSTSNIDEAEETIDRSASSKAADRIYELIDLYNDTALNADDVNVGASETKIKAAISNWSVSNGYKKAVVNEEKINEKSDDWYREQLTKDYEYVLEQFRKELESDYTAAKEGYDLTTKPYSDWSEKFESEVFKFLFYEGIITPVYEQVLGKDNKEKIVKFDNEQAASTYNTKEKAIEHVYKNVVENKFDQILSVWGTYSTVLTQFTADAKSIILQAKKEASEDKVENISGIVSLGHVANGVTEVSGKWESGETKSYVVAHQHNEDGTVVNSSEYDVLQITIDGVDPKAIYNFSFTVAPVHYYTAATLDDYLAGNYVKVDIANNKFGVKWGDSEFQSKVIQSSKNVSVPMGAGVYCATDANDSDNPDGKAFWNSGIVYYKANRNFEFEVKHEKMRLKVVSSSGAIVALERGEVDYITPQLTNENYDELGKLASKGIVRKDALQLGYGYIGINAGKITNINARKAIMAAMNTELSLEHYRKGTCEQILYPMSKVSWAYPRVGTNYDDTLDSRFSKYAYFWPGDDKAKQYVEEYTQAAIADGAPASDFKVTFTIAGASITDHPTYKVFKKAAEILNELDAWTVEVKADSQALTKLSTGSLQVWAAAWGSTIDPDMYQVYHINSTATSTYAWGYREIKNKQDSVEYSIIKNQLSPMIEAGRNTLNEEERKSIYKTAMEYVLDLAVELPVYQRSNLFAYNTSTVKGFYEDITPYASPINEIWNLELVA